jgi:flavin reductase (DIM6/NTAB) family NADH-FMN oxidoreductase RutF
MSESGDASFDASPLDARGPEAQDFYKTLSGSVAKGVAVLSTVYRGRDYAATVTDFLSVSYDPPTMLASLYSLSRMAEALETQPRWALSLLAADQQWIAARLGETGTPLIGLLDNIPHFRREPGAPALITGALAWFELTTVKTTEAATHTLVVGEVEWMTRPSVTPAAPLIRFRSSY